MSKKGADLVGSFGREDMLKLAGLLLDFRFAVHGQAVSKETLGQTMPADDAARSLAPARREFHDQSAVAHRGSYRLKRIVARVDERLVSMGQRRMRR